MIRSSDSFLSIWYSIFFLDKIRSNFFIFFPQEVVTESLTVIQIELIFRIRITTSQLRRYINFKTLSKQSSN